MAIDSTSLRSSTRSSSAVIMRTFGKGGAPSPRTQAVIASTSRWQDALVMAQVDGPLAHCKPASRVETVCSFPPPPQAARPVANTRTSPRSQRGITQTSVQTRQHVGKPRPAALPSRMAFARIAFPDLPWTPGNHPLERKKTVPERCALLLELAPGFEDPNVCERSHILLVLSGVLELDVDGAAQRLRAGECCLIDAGTPHRARNPGAEPVVAFVASEVEWRRG
jgi:mannose-6-phosphate isomerase-like protein (cupin superfamily)